MRCLLLCLILFFVVSMASSHAQEKVNGKKDELKLKDLFPKKSFFGPSARSPEFSHDGKYAAYLYRPLKEQRHGSDLWLLDVASGKVSRLTSVSVMAKFQSSTRKVKEHRIKLAKAAVKEAAKKKGKKDADKKRKMTQEQKNGDWVSDKDADDKKAPRYSGISSFSWSPKANELLFISGGDMYRYQLEGKKLTRLSKTKSSETGLKYLPDGKGFVYGQFDREDRTLSLRRVQFGSHFIEQLEPKLPSGEKLAGYRLSPDGKKLVLRTYKEKEDKDERKVKIASYKKRFVEVKEYSRRVADDPKRERTIGIYLYVMTEPEKENGQLSKVFEHKESGPRDILGTPQWSPDSQKVAFVVFEQKSSQVSVYEATCPKEEKKDKKKSKKTSDKKESTKATPKTDKSAEKKTEKTKDENKQQAKLVYRFLHRGGPNTPRLMTPYYMADSQRIVILTEKSGFRQLHVLDPVYESFDQLTRGRFEVYPFDISKDHKTLYVTSTKEHPARVHVYKVNLEDGVMTRLSIKEGNYSSVAVSPKGDAVLANHSAYGKLRELVVVHAGDKKTSLLTDSHGAKAKKYTKPVPKFFTYKNRHGHKIYGHLFQPDGWKKTDKRPLLIYVYGGPLGTRNQLSDGSYSTSAYFFAWYMAKKHGYVTCTIDPRGVSGYGAMFEKANFEKVGKPQVEDLVDGVKYFIKNYGVDPKRVGIHGWSFGGFQTQMCLYTKPDVFAAGIAGAGPTEWENYNSWYTTGTIGNSREGKTDLQKFSLLPLAKNLKSRLLLIHGMEDSNVLYQDTVRVYRELLKAGKETLVELFLDPTGGHGLGGDIKTLAKFRKYEEFLLRTLGNGMASKVEAKS
ncbi:MAG: prolyl oligopeptidase family serine peptidase [Gemmataceae bacterium]